MKKGVLVWEERSKEEANEARDEEEFKNSEYRRGNENWQKAAAPRLFYVETAPPMLSFSLVIIKSWKDHA